MKRKWTLVSAFAAIAMISWAQPPSRTTATQAATQKDQNEQPTRRPRAAQDTDRETPRRATRPNPNAGAPSVPTPSASDQLVRPGQTQPSPVAPSAADKTPFVPPPVPDEPGESRQNIEKLREQIREKAGKRARQPDNGMPTPVSTATPAEGTPSNAARPSTATGETSEQRTPRAQRERNQETPRADRSPETLPSPETSPTPGTEADRTPVERTNQPSATPRAETTAPAKPGESPAAPANATPFVPTDMPENLQRQKRPGQTPRTESAESPAVQAPKAPVQPENAVSPTPASEKTPATVMTPSATASPSPRVTTPPKAAATPGAPRTTPAAIDSSQATSETLNSAAANLLDKGPKRTRRDPANAKLTPWIAPKVVTSKEELEAAEKSGAAPPVVVLPPGATPTPTPAPERIIVRDRSEIIDNIKNTTLAPTPPPAPTPGATPVATPPGVTPVPRNWKPDRDWVPYPGWRPPQNWSPPRGWVPPGGWTPPPGWEPPREWIPRLRNWGWSYIPRRGWVVPVQWTPPPDFVVPPNWYYMPTSAYDDYGFYDPSQIAVMPGRARSDLQININTNQIYMPPAPPPMLVTNAPPPPPRPAPPQPPPVPEQITQVSQVVDVFSRPRQPNEPRYQGPVLVTGSVHFDYDSYAIQPDSFPTLDAIGTALVQEMPDAIINVEGHTDSDGSDEYNQTLSEQRAWSVKSYLVQKFGLDPNRLIIVGYGERAPIADNNSDTGKARNRRVEFENVTDLYSAQVVDTAAPATEY